MSTDSTVSTNVDFCYDGYASLEDGLSDLNEKYPDLEFEVVVERGPAGGWPTLAVSGPRYTVVRCLRQFFDVQDDVELWSLYGIATVHNNACVVRSTFDKLGTHLNALLNEGWTPTPHFVGGRDWVITCVRDDSRTSGLVI